MELWVLGIVIAGAGAVGGIINALLTDNRGFEFWQLTVVDGAKVWRPGFIGNLLIGAAAAFVTWGLYGRYAGFPIIGTPSEMEEANFSETLAGVTGALLAGVGGARVLTGEVDKKLLQLAASQAAIKNPSPDKAAMIATVSPGQALQVAKDL